MKLKKAVSLVLSLLTAVLVLAACSGAPAEAAGAAGSSAESAAQTATLSGTPEEAADAASSSPDSAAQTVTLSIGLPEHMQTVEVQAADKEPETLLRALAEETGWNLTLAEPAGRYSDGYPKVALAADSAPYTEPPESQKDAYRVYDAEDWIYTVFNSISATFQANGEPGVCFTSPEGGDLYLEQGGIDFHLMAQFAWDYDTAYKTNHPDPEYVTLALKYPNGYSAPLGLGQMEVIFAASDMSSQGGTLTIYDENDQVYETVDLTLPDTVSPVANAEEYGVFANFKESSGFGIRTEHWIEQPGKYTVHLDEGAFRTPDGRENAEIKPEDWSFEVAPYGIIDSTLPEGEEDCRLGVSYAFTVVIDGEQADRVWIEYDPELYQISAENLTETTTVTLLPLKLAEDAAFTIHFYQGDEELAPLDMSGAIVE